MSIKQAKLILNAHRHNLLNSFCNNGIVNVKQHENGRKIVRERERETDRETETEADRDRETERDRDRQTDRQRQRQ